MSSGALWLSAVVVWVGVLVLGLGVMSSVAFGLGSCGNAGFRVGVSAGLPDCRAYELVSPLGFEPFKSPDSDGFQAAIGGSAISFYSKFGAPPGAVSYGSYFLSKRRVNGWSTVDVVPPQSVAHGDFCYPSVVFSPDLSMSVLQDGWNWGNGYPRFVDDNGSTDCSHDEPGLVAGEPVGAQNLFLRDGATGSYTLLNGTGPGVSARDAWFQAGSSDFSHLVFTDPLPLLGNAPTPPANGAAKYSVGEILYEWVGGVVRLVAFMPDGEPTLGFLVNGQESGGYQASAGWTHAVSVDGERVLFYAGGEVLDRSHGERYVGGGLFLRENAGQAASGVVGGRCSEPSRGCTVEVDVVQAGGSGVSGGGKFQWATPDGSRVFFTDESRLTVDSKAEVGKPDLYVFEPGSVTGGAGVVRDVSVAGGGEAADVQGLSGISDDGRYAYFVADGVLAGNKNSHEDEATAGRPNLYLWHEGVLTFIATLDAFGEDVQENYPEGDSCDWESYFPLGDVVYGKASEDCMSARVSGDGRFVVFDSLRGLTGYDNEVVGGGGERDHEIFLFDASSGGLVCVSCDPSGAPPTASARGGEDPHVEAPRHDEQWYRTPSYLPRVLSDGGRVFFGTANKLLPADVNGVEDVYEWEGGELHLISSGAKEGDPSFFRDASASGGDVFFVTAQRLVGGDVDNTLGLYDARVGGGFAEPVGPGVPCESEVGCAGVVGGSGLLGVPGSVGFVGAGVGVRGVGPFAVVCRRGFRRVLVGGRVVCRRVVQKRGRGGGKGVGRVLKHRRGGGVVVGGGR